MSKKYENVKEGAGECEKCEDYQVKYIYIYIYKFQGLTV